MVDIVGMAIRLHRTAELDLFLLVISKESKLELLFQG
jgi:hypothetical protein